MQFVRCPRAEELAVQSLNRFSLFLAATIYDFFIVYLSDECGVAQIGVVKLLLRRANPLKQVGVQIDVNLFLFGDDVSGQAKNAPNNERQCK